MKNIVLVVVFVVGCALAGTCDAQRSRSGDRIRNRNSRGLQDWASNKTWQQRGLINVQVGSTHQNVVQDSTGCVDGNCGQPSRVISRMPGTRRAAKNYTVRKSLPFIPYKSSSSSGVWCHPCHGCPPDGYRWVYDCSCCCWMLEPVPDSGQ